MVSLLSHAFVMCVFLQSGHLSQLLVTILFVCNAVRNLETETIINQY